jgi:hypothetical protein
MGCHAECQSATVLRYAIQGIQNTDNSLFLSILAYFNPFYAHNFYLTHKNISKIYFKIFYKIVYKIIY